MTINITCVKCNHYFGSKRCLAYPVDRIPDEIWKGGTHKQVRKDQKGEYTFKEE